MLVMLIMSLGCYATRRHVSVSWGFVPSSRVECLNTYVSTWKRCWERFFYVLKCIMAMCIFNKSTNQWLGLSSWFVGSPVISSKCYWHLNDWSETAARQCATIVRITNKVLFFFFQNQLFCLFTFFECSCFCISICQVIRANRCRIYKVKSTSNLLSPSLTPGNVGCIHYFCPRRCYASTVL